MPSIFENPQRNRKSAVSGLRLPAAILALLLFTAPAPFVIQPAEAGPRATPELIQDKRSGRWKVHGEDYIFTFTSRRIAIQYKWKLKFFDDAISDGDFKRARGHLSLIDYLATEIKKWNYKPTRYDRWQHRKLVEKLTRIVEETEAKAWDDLLYGNSNGNGNGGD